MAAFLDNGILDVLNVQYRLENGFVVNGQRLLPQAFIVSVDEPAHSGENTIIFAKVHALTLKGQKVWIMGEKDLEVSGIYDNTWVCRIEKTHQLVCWREGTKEMSPVPEDMWKNKLEDR